MARFKGTASCCDLPQRQYFEDLFNEMGESSLMTKTLICRRIIKKMLSFFVCVFYVYSSETTISSVTTQHFNNLAII